MANKDHLAVLRQGVDAWNAWRMENILLRPDLSSADLHQEQLWGVNFCRTNLREVRLSNAFLGRADFGKADLSKADLRNAKLYGARFQGAILYKADLRVAGLTGADFTEADLTKAQLAEATIASARLVKTVLRGADLRAVCLRYATLVRTDFTGANLTGCYIYGSSAWRVKLKKAKQQDIVITPQNELKITVDNLEIAQFIYLLLHNEKIRHVIDTITSKVVLILGRFTDERKAVLDALREELRKRDYSPIVFDFDKPASKDLTGTVQMLANMAGFVIADLTDPSCIPHELAMVVPNTMVAVQPVLLEGQREYAMFVDLKWRHHWVLEPYRYASPGELIASLAERVIGPAEAKARELHGAKAESTV